MFLKKLANEARFLKPIFKQSLGSENKVSVQTEGEGLRGFTLVVVTTDDKVTGVLSELEEGELMSKGQAIVSPLLNGKREYMRWVQESLNSVKATAASSLLDTPSALPAAATAPAKASEAMAPAPAAANKPAETKPAPEAAPAKAKPAAAKA